MKTSTMISLLLLSGEYFLSLITFIFLFYIFLCRPTGQFAYAFTKNFLVIYDLDLDTVSTQLGNSTWPDTSFLPYAVDVSRDLLFIVLGYVGDSSTNYTPCAYLLTIVNGTFTVLDVWLYTPPSSTSWQASLTNWDADVYAAKYDMSVSINDAGDQVLFGIQITNTIIIFNIDRTNRTFGSSLQTLSNGKAIGMGKSVGWLDTNLILVLANTYSFNYIWSSSHIFAYNVTVANSFDVLFIFPSMQQVLSPTFGPILLSLVITQNNTVAMLDSDGDYYILLPSPAGSFSDSSSGTSSSSSSLCIGGTFAPKMNIFPCSLCPSGTTTGGLIGQSACVPCNGNAFCPLGSAFGNISLSSSILANNNQASAYPLSPQSIRFDNILIQNMFTIRTASTPHCLLVSPLFWTIIASSFGLFIWFMMFIFKHYISHPMGKKTREQMKRIFKKSDMIGEGEWVIGGLFSFAILVLVVFAYTFSNFYLYRYPIENVTGDATFACDRTITNAEFSSGLMAIAVPPTDDQAPIFTLLDAQSLTLHIDFINTLFKCPDASAKLIKDVSIPMTISSCKDTNGSLSLSLLLPSHTINLQILLTGTNTIGGLRIGLTGSGVYVENGTFNAAYTLVDLTYAQTSFISGRILTQQPSYGLELIKIINHTYPLADGGETQYSGLWLPIFSGSSDEIFVNGNEFQYATSSSTTLSIMITETPYYVINTERPITSVDELIFANLIFTIVCLEIFGLGFLIFKLIIIPLIKYIIRYFHRSSPTETSSVNNIELSQIFFTRL
jgi:hypothetical protein